MEHLRNLQSTMTGRIATITRIDDRIYQVMLESQNGSKIGTFVFEVRKGAIDVVTWRQEFVDYIGLKAPPMTELFAAILAFHRAQELALPPWD
jgi:hypothetical protein